MAAMPIRPATNCAIPVLNEKALRVLESRHSHDGLMERAGAAAAELALQLRLDDARPVLVVAGPGNNGGDAAVVARRLLERGVAVHLWTVGAQSKRPADADAAFAALSNSSAICSEDAPREMSASLVIDGLFGIGLSRVLSGQYAAAVDEIQGVAARSRCPILALDCPSGLNAETGDKTGPAVRADATISFIACKPGLLTGNGVDLTGDLWLDSLGIADAEVEALAGGHWLGADCLSHLHARHRNSHKGDFGTLGILGGAPGMTGAAILAGRAALKNGCGRVFVGLRDDGTLFDPVQPELMIRNPSGLAKAPLDALVCGPGLGTDTIADALLTDILQSPLPLVLDADALTLIGADGLATLRLKTRHAPTLVTPHPGEAARMLHRSVREVMRDRVDAALTIAREFNVWAALKGAGTVIASPTGSWWINRTGNPLLASAGTGDVLAGLVGAYLAQGKEPRQALQTAVYLHGLAADRLFERGLRIGLTASELIDEVRAASSDLVVGVLKPIQ